MAEDLFADTSTAVDEPGWGGGGVVDLSGDGMHITNPAERRKYKERSRKRKKSGHGLWLSGPTGPRKISQPKRHVSPARLKSGEGRAMQRSLIQHNTPSTFDAHKYLRARERMRRRVQLWANARARLGNERFFENLGAVESAVSDQLRREGLD